MLAPKVLRVVLLLLGGALATAQSALAADPAGAAKTRLYVGTYTGPKSKGIYLLEMDPATGALTAKGVAGETTNPSYLALHPSRKFVYAVGEVGEFNGKKTGVVSAFSVDPQTGKLTLLNQQSSGGTGPCYVAVDRQGKTALVANYNGGSVASLPIQEDGRLGEPASVIQHKGSSANPKRQEGPHAHSINLDPANHVAVAADLGLDKLLVYKLDAAKGTLTPNEPPSAALAPGAGPRHLDFHPSGRHAYVINELNSTMTAFSYDPQHGSFKELQTLSTLPEGFKGTNYPADVHVHPSGKFVYGSNRGHDSIVIYKIDPATGRLTYVGTQSTQGKQPRNFGIDPTGTYLLAANQGTSNIVVFRIDAQTGELKPTGQQVSVPAPVCVKFVSQGPG